MYNFAKNFIHNFGKSMRIQHPMECTNKYCRLGIDLGGQHACLILRHVAGVLLVPWYDFNLLCFASLVVQVVVEVVVCIVVVVAIVYRWYEYCVEVVLSAVLYFFATVGKHALNCRLVLEYNVDVAGCAALLSFANVGHAWMLLVFARYFQLDRAVLLEQLDQVLLVHVPRQSTQEHFARVDRVLRVGLWG